MPDSQSPLEHKLQQKTAQLAALREIGQAINAAWELKATLELITRKTAEVMGMDSCSIYLLDEARQYLVLQATTGLAPQAVGQARLGLGEGLTGWAAQRGQPVAVADAARDPRFKYLPETGETVFQSLLAVPLVNQGRVIGAANVQTRAYHDYGADEVELLSLIADLAAGALEKAMLYERMQRQIRELSTLAEVSETVTSPLFLDDMLKLIVEMAAQVMQARLCSLMLLDEEQGELILHATQSYSSAYRGKPPLKLGEGIAGWVAQSGQPRVVEDVRREPDYRYADIARQEGLCSLLCVPLKVRDRVIGVLNFYTAVPHHFTKEEIAFFSTLANQTALAIENARLVTNAAVVREMHHRIKNNLQNVALLLRLQMGQADQRQGLSLREVLQEAINRIQSIAAVHEVLSQKGFRQVDIKELLSRVVRGLLENAARPELHLSWSVEGVSFALPSQPATSLALVINELVQNALQHAFVGRQQGHIRIKLAERHDRWVITVADDGVGSRAQMNNTGQVLPRKPGQGEAPGLPLQGLGLEIVHTLVHDDLRGELARIPGPSGTTVEITIPQ